MEEASEWNGANLDVPLGLTKRGEKDLEEKPRRRPRRRRKMRPFGL